MLLVAVCVTAQDILNTKDLGRIEVKIYEVSDSFVKYKPISNQDGPLLKMDSGNIVSVEFANGIVYKFDNRDNKTSENRESKVNDAKMYLEQNAKEQNDMCPLKLTNVMTLDKVEYSDGVYTYYISLKKCSFSKKFMEYPMEQKFSTVNMWVNVNFKDKEKIEGFWSNLIVANALCKVETVIVDKNE